MKKDIKYIFLDIDGVLNGIDTMELDYRLNHTYSYKEIDLKCLLYFNELCKKLNYPKIVISSSWRFFENKMYDLTDIFERFNSHSHDKEVLKIFDTLPLDRNKRRPQLIRDYIQKSHIADNEYLILDDEFDYGDLMHYHTNQYSGLDQTALQQIYKKVGII